MLNKKTGACIALWILLVGQVTAQNIGLGQTITIRTQLEGFVGRPSWLLVIRDVDHGQNIPYLYDIEDENNAWTAFTYSDHYFILASTLYFSPYQSHPYRSRKINNFCNLESRGRLVRGESFIIRILGDLSPVPGDYRCLISRFPSYPYRKLF